MQISSLTHERLERLKKQIADKKAEKDELEALDEKDLWCKDLQDFEEEWENQMRLDDEIRSNIRKMGRRVSKKIGAGKGGKRKNDDDEYAPKAPKSRKAAPAKEQKKLVIAPPKTTAHARFASTFSKSKQNPAGNDGAQDSDEDFAASFGRGTSSKPEPVKKPTPVVDLSDDDDDFAALAKPESKAAPVRKPSPFELSDDDDEFAEPAKPEKKAAAPARKPSPIDLSDEDEDDDFTAPAKPKPKTKAAPAKKASPMDISNEEEDDDFAAPSKPQSRAKRAPAKKSATAELSDDEEDDDVAAPSKAKAKGKAKKPSPVESEVEEEPSVEELKPTTGRTKRAAATKAKKWAFEDSDEESESDGDNMIGDVGAMVRGIGGPAADAKNGRLSLFAMSRSEHGNTAIPKLKTKQSRNLDLDSPDDTNYELLAKSSPQKPTRSSDIDDLVSEGEDAPAPATKASGKAKQGKAPLNVVSAAPAKKGNSRANKAEDGKPSPAAKAYAAKNKSSTAAAKGKKKTFDFSDEDEQDEDGDVVMEDSPPPRARGRPGRAAAAKKTYALPSDDEDESDVYAMDDSD